MIQGAETAGNTYLEFGEQTAFVSNILVYMTYVDHLHGVLACGDGLAAAAATEELANLSAAFPDYETRIADPGYRSDQIAHYDDEAIDYLAWRSSRMHAARRTGDLSSRRVIEREVSEREANISPEAKQQIMTARQEVTKQLAKASGYVPGQR